MIKQHATWWIWCTNFNLFQDFWNKQRIKIIHAITNLDSVVLKVQRCLLTCQGLRKRTLRTFIAVVFMSAASLGSKNKNTIMIITVILHVTSAVKSPHFNQTFASINLQICSNRCVIHHKTSQHPTTDTESWVIVRNSYISDTKLAFHRVSW